MTTATTAPTPASTSASRSAVTSRREDLIGLLGDVERLESIFAAWEETPRGAVEAYRRAIEALYGEALRRLVRALKADPSALAAMRGAVSDEVVYAVLRRQQILKPSLDERVEAALESIRPMLATHGGNVELVGVTPPAVSVRFVGSCDGCPASSLTFHEGVEKAVKEACPEITTITQVKGMSGGQPHTVADNAAHTAEVDGQRLVSPFELNRSATWRRASDVSEIPEGGVRAFDVGGESVLLARFGSVVTGFDNACAHLGLPLDDGRVERGVLVCQHHGFQYDLSSGECITAPSVRLRPREVRIVGPRVEIRVER